jgi:hypothetical protein
MCDVIEFNLPGECDPNIDCLFRYWRSIHPVSGLPARSDFDPLDLPAACWPHICLLDVTYEPLRFRIRFIGTEIVRFKKRDGTGQYLDDLNPEFENSKKFEMYQSCVTSGIPAYGHANSEPVSKTYSIISERICLPFASDGSTVDVLLIMSKYQGNRKSRRVRLL